MQEKPPVKVGVLTCERDAHIRDIWGPIIQPYGEKTFLNTTTRMTNMVMTHVWDINREASEDFAKSLEGIEIVDHYADMVGDVDGVILSNFESCSHYRELTAPYLEAGIPIFINRPFALNLEDANYMLDLARKHDTPVMSGSSFEFAPEVVEIRTQIADLQPLSGYAVAVSTSDYATHGIHGLFFAYACVGGGIRTVSYQTRDWREPNGMTVIEHEQDGERPFFGSVQQFKGPLGWIRISGRKRRSIEQSVGGSIHFWLPILLEMQKMFETREMPQPYEVIMEKTKLFLAGFKSHVEYGGRPVALPEIGDWRAPLLNPDPYPEGYFG